MTLSKRHQRLLAGARRDGFLRAAGAEDDPARRAWGRWCMKMRVPVLVWLRPTKTARQGKLMLDLCTTPNELSTQGQEAIRLMLARQAPRGKGKVESVGAEWPRVSAHAVPAAAKELYRMATSLGIYEPDMRRLAERRSEMTKRLKLPVPIRTRRKAIA